MKKLPKFLFAMIFTLVFAVVLLPEIKEDLSGLSKIFSQVYKNVF